MAQQVFATQVRQPELTPGKGGKKELTPKLFSDSHLHCGLNTQEWACAQSHTHTVSTQKNNKIM